MFALNVAFSAWQYSSDDIAKLRGVDAAIYLETVKYLFLITCCFTLYGYAVLAPVHATAGGGLIGTAMISMGNVPDQDAR